MTRHSSFNTLRRALHRAGLLAGLVASAALAACGGFWDEPPAAQLSGVAATGAAIVNGQVQVVNASGESASTRTDSAGRYQISLSDAPPFVLSVTDASGATWYSYAASSGTAHITPLTTLALLDANASKPLANLMQSWSSAAISEARVLQAAKTVNANLSSLMGTAGVDARSVNVFTEPGFAANRSGLDAVLDAMRVNLACSPSLCERSITSPAGSVLVSWNGDIATTGITVSWAISGTPVVAGGSGSTGSGGSTGSTGGTGSTGSTGSTGGTSGSVTIGLGSCKAAVAGTWSMVVQTSVAGVGVPIPEVCVDGLPGAPTSEADFCGNDSYKSQLPPGVSILSCSFAGDTGTIAARITSPISIDYTVKYTFVKR